MSLQYIIDGYNIIHHPIFTQHVSKKIKDQRVMLLELIRVKRLAGSQRNKITVVFDGYPNPGGIFGSFENKEGPDVIFSRKETADERIKNMVQHYPKTRDVIVVSDDKEIKFFIASCGAKAMGVEEFFGMSKEKLRRKEEQEEALKPEITYSQMREINEELKKIWLSK